ncbi:MAG: sigma-70 family RNA polymerase sigma factor [Anaerolineales bacterium]|nr:sigma-70 family RNA polymerase sigma factor [Anaerolineales bacterium]
MDNETQLIRRAQKGDSAAFEKLVNENAQYVYNLALRILGNPQDAEDLAQEAFVRVWKNIKKFRAEARFRTWLYRIVTNLCYDRLPRLRKELSLLEPDDELELPEERYQPEDELLSAELRTQIHTAIDNLPEAYKLLITLRHLQALSYAEIAEVTSQPLGTVKTGIHRARKQLRGVIQAYEEIS